MIGLRPGARIWIAAGITDMRKGFDGLAALVQETLAEDPFSGQLFVFRGRRGDLVKCNRRQILVLDVCDFLKANELPADCRRCQMSTRWFNSAAEMRQ